MQAIVLAGGLGTRIRGAISHDIPKPMAPVAGKPFLEYLLNYLSQNKIEHVTLSVGYKHESISNHFGTHFGGMDLLYAVEEEPLGTGGAIRLAMHMMPDNGDQVLLLNGDTLFPVEIKKLLSFHSQANAGITLALKHLSDCSRYGSVGLSEGGEITAFREKQSQSQGLINGGVYIINKSIITEADLPAKFSFENFLAEKLGDLDMYGMRFDQYFRDIGIPEDYHIIQDEIQNHI